MRHSEVEHKLFRLTSDEREKLPLASRKDQYPVYFHRRMFLDSAISQSIVSIQNDIFAVRNRLLRIPRVVFINDCQAGVPLGPDPDRSFLINATGIANRYFDTDITVIAMSDVTVNWLNVTDTLKVDFANKLTNRDDIVAGKILFLLLFNVSPGCRFSY